MGQTYKRIAAGIWLVALVTVVSKLSGQFYPFSEFGMYSSFPNHAEVYYLTDADNRVVKTTEGLGIDAARFKQIIEHRRDKLDDNAMDANELLAVAARGCLLQLIQEKDSAKLADKYGQLKVWQKNLHLNNSHIQMHDLELTVWP
jgi:hypothetical protein